MDQDFTTEEAGNLTNQFSDWVADALIQLTELETAITESGGKDLVAAKEVYNIAHNIKGLSASFGFNLMTSIGTNICNYLRVLDDRDHVDPKAVSAHIKAFHVIIDNAILGDGGEEGRAVLTRLKQLTH